MAAHNDEKKKKVAIISISSLILVVMVIAVTVGIKTTGSAAKHAQKAENHEPSTAMKAITAICQPTDFKEACVESLSNANTSDPKGLVRAGFQAAMQQLLDAARRSTTLQELEKDPRASQALQNCKELMEYAINDLQTSFEKLGEFSLSKVNTLLSDLKIWLSAAITYQETCLDGFQNTTGDAGEQMRQALNMSAKLTSNALAMVTDVSSTLSSLQIPGLSRRLLSEDIPVLGHDDELLPNWFDQGRRRLLLHSARPQDLKPNVTVAKDGSGDYATINEALNLIPKNGSEPFVVYIKAGVYKEEVRISRSMTHVVMVGDGPELTKITGSKNYVDGTPTFKTATVSVFGAYFMAKNIGFENSAGAIKHQAVALLVQSDMSIFHNCRMDGYQDTLYVHTERQFYRDCTITGTIDFIFGDAAAVFQNCKLVVRKPLDNQHCIVTAQGRKENRQPTAIVLQNCTFTADRDYFPMRKQIKSYLGRPWKEFSRTIILESYIEDLIQPEGWLPWSGDFALNTCYYSEFHNRGPGAEKAGRVRWRGIKRLTPENAAIYTPGKFIEGDSWIPPTGVPYNSGFITNAKPHSGGHHQ